MTELKKDHRKSFRVCLQLLIFWFSLSTPDKERFFMLMGLMHPSQPQAAHQFPSFMRNSKIFSSLLLSLPSSHPVVVPPICSQEELKGAPRSSLVPAKPHPCSLSQVVPLHLNLRQTQLCFAMQPCRIAVFAEQLRTGGLAGFPPAFWPGGTPRGAEKTLPRGTGKQENRRERWGVPQKWH